MINGQSKHLDTRRRVDQRLNFDQFLAIKSRGLYASRESALMSSCQNYCLGETVDNFEQHTRDHSTEQASIFMVVMLPYFMTMIPLLVASLQSMLSTPVPARPMIFSFFPAAMTSAVTFVADRTMSPS